MTGTRDGAIGRAERYFDEGGFLAREGFGQFGHLRVALFVSQHAAQPLVTGEGGTASLGNTIEVLTGQKT